MNTWKHVGAAVALVGAVAIGEYFTNSLNTDTVIAAFVAGYTGSFTYQSFIARIEAALSGMATKVSNAVTGVTPTPDSTTIPTSFTLSVSNTAAAIGDSVTYALSGGVANGTATLYQVGLPQDNSGAISGIIPLDSTGAGSLTMTLSKMGPIGATISAEGSISIYALDSADNESNMVTMS